MHPLAQLDHQFVWHPFTQMRDWLQARADRHRRGQRRGAARRSRPRISRRQFLHLDQSARPQSSEDQRRHPAAARKNRPRSALGLANEPASLLAAKLVEAANPQMASRSPREPARNRPPQSEQGFLLATTVPPRWKSRSNSPTNSPAAPEREQPVREAAEPKFLSLDGAYHGDTVGAVALGHIDLFHQSYAGLLFKTDKVMAPYCYRCPFNRAKPERADAREYRKCNWECVGKVEQKFAAQKRKGNPYAAFVFEPLMQGAAGMIPQPPGWLRRVTEIARGHGALLIADEVMTGFGRTGSLTQRSLRPIASGSTLNSSVCLPPRRRAAGFSVPGQGADRRLSADGGDSDDAEGLRRLSGRIRGVQNLFPRPQLTRPINSARRRRWPAWTFCRANHPFARGRCWKRSCTTNCKRFGRCPTSATSGRSV